MSELTDDELLDMIDEFCDESMREDDELIIKALDDAAKKAIKEAVEVLSKFKEDLSHIPEVKAAIDMLAKLAVLGEAETEEEEEEEPGEKFKDLKNRLKILEEEKGTKKSLKGQDGDDGDEEIVKGRSFPWSFSLSGEEEEED